LQWTSAAYTLVAASLTAAGRLMPATQVPVVHAIQLAIQHAFVGAFNDTACVAAFILAVTLLIVVPLSRPGDRVRAPVVPVPDRNLDDIPVAKDDSSYTGT
jgi:hypothetical protein